MRKKQVKKQIRKQVREELLMEHNEGGDKGGDKGTDNTFRTIGDSTFQHSTLETTDPSIFNTMENM